MVLLRLGYHVGSPWLDDRRHGASRALAQSVVASGEIASMLKREIAASQPHRRRILIWQAEVIDMADTKSKKVEGALDKLGGKIQEATGKMTGDQDEIEKGRKDEARGEAKADKHGDPTKVKR